MAGLPLSGRELGCLSWGKTALRVRNKKRLSAKNQSAYKPQRTTNGGRNSKPSPRWPYSPSETSQPTKHSEPSPTAHKAAAGDSFVQRRKHELNSSIIGLLSSRILPTTNIFTINVKNDPPPIAITSHNIHAISKNHRAPFRHCLFCFIPMINLGGPLRGLVSLALAFVPRTSPPIPINQGFNRLTC